MNIVDRVTSKGIPYEISDSRAREEKLDRSELPDKLSAFKNDLELINKNVKDLQNYYNKSETYSKAEIDQKLALKLRVYIVDELPTEEIDRSAIYFIPRATAEASASDAYDEYIWAGDWELIGNTHVDLSNYYTKAEADLKTAGKIAEETAARASADTAINAEISALKTEDESLDGKITTEKNRAEYAELQLQNAIGNSDSSIAAETMRAQTAENSLSDRMFSFEQHLDDTGNPHSVTAGQVGLGNVANVGTDASPTMNSRNNVESGGVFSALEGKVDKVSGKGLSDQNFTYEEKTKLSNLSNYDDTELNSRVTATESAITTLNGDSSVSGSVDKKIADAMSSITGFDFKIVSDLPASGEKGIIYLTPQPTQGEQDSYDEYIWLDSAWEYLGKKSVTVDLTDYYTKAQVSALVSVKQDKITVADDSSTLTDDDSFDETPAGTNGTTVKRRRLPSLWAYIKNKIETYFAPVDVVESGNMNPVTSNAVAEALAVETGAGTPATNWAGTIYWVKTGHVVQVSVRDLQYTLSGVPAVGTVIATGLPKSVLSNEIFIAGPNGDLGGNYVAMTNNGSLIVKNFNNTKSISHFHSFTYVTSE